MDKILCQLCDYKDSPDCPHNSNICHSFRSEDKDCLRIVAKTASLVATQIFKELEDLIPMFYINHVQDYLAIKSRWVKE